MRWSVQNALVSASVLIHKCFFYIVKIIYNTCLIVTLMIMMSFFDSQVDKHIRRLDADLARFENELKEKLEVGGYESTDGRAVKSELLAEKLPRVLVAQAWIQLQVIMSFEQKVSPGGSERNVAPGGEVEKVQMTIPPKRKR